MTEEIKTDYFIAGAGIAGVLLAGRLAATGKKVVILDQGPRFSEEDRANMLKRGKDTLNDFAGYNDEAPEGTVTAHTSAPHDNNTAGWTNWRVFGIGGTALHFEGFMVRPTEDDLRVKSLFGYGRDWPIKYSELEPWLLLAEQETGVAGNALNPYASPRSEPFPMPAHEFSYFDREIFGPALMRLGIAGHSCPRAINSINYRGRSACMACRACRFCPTGARYSPDRVHVPELDKSPNVTIMENASLRRLETSTVGDSVVAAHMIKVQDKKPVVIRAKRYVLSMGGVETPRMLMLSADGGAHNGGLGNRGGMLGQRFSDHLNPLVVYDAGRHVGSRLGFETMISEHFRIRVNRREEPTFIVFASPALDWYPVGDHATSWASTGGILSLKDLRESIPRMVGMYIMTELEGKGLIELDPDTLDAFGDPVAKVTARLTDWDLRSVEHLKRFAPRLAEAMDVWHVSDVTNEYNMGFHPSGATAMAETPDDGVCDRNLKVFGLENLYLVSNSVFPHMGANPPTLTIAALALRLAAHLEGGRA
jgi:choline dehydrogenase-like flavoprotein